MAELPPHLPGPELSGPESWYWSASELSYCLELEQFEAGCPELEPLELGLLGLEWLEIGL